MRPTRATVLLTAGLVALLGVPAGAAAAAETPANLYVNNAEDSNCSDGGSGSPAVPFCTISAAAKVVKPGQTVRIKTWATYDENVTIDRSGEPGKPITLTADTEDFSSAAYLGRGKGLTISGASHVVVRGLQSHGGIKVNRSNGVELDRIHASNPGFDGLVVGDGSANVRVTRSGLIGARIEGGAQGTVLSRNEINNGSGSASKVLDAPGTVITNNTFTSSCAAAISVSGGSSGSALFNNVLSTWPNNRCEPAAPRQGIAVSASATEGTRADYNLITGPETELTLYSWAGADYQTPAAFKAATGQGAHDILAAFDDVGPKDGSPTIDSGDPTAPGVLPTDKRGKPTADDPRVPNTGKDGGYVDRGAWETQDVLKSVRLDLDQAWAPVGTPVKAKATPDDLWPAALTYRFDFGDGTAPVVTKALTAEHVYSAPCDCAVTVTAVNGIGETVSDSRSTKVTAPGPLTASFTATLALPTSTSPIGGPSPLTVDIDAASTAAPWPLASSAVDFGDGKSASHEGGMGYFAHVYSLPGEYKVTLTLKDVKGATSTATRTVRVDYAPSGYIASEPFRLLDTRTNNTPVQGNYARSVDLPVGTRIRGHELSGGMASVVLNVTVTDATQDAYLNVWPSGQPRPATSNLNIRAGGTSSNTITVPVGPDGRVNAQLNAGQASLIVDFVGYYQPNVGQKFSPINPSRLADTREAGGALGGGQTRTVKVAGVAGIPADASAVALNLTSTGTTSDTYVVAYPDPAKRPLASNLNPEPGKNKANQVIVPVGPNGTITLYNHWGSTDLVVDAVGFYGKEGKALFTPVVPKRLADTRNTVKLAPGATSTVAGVPAGAVGAVLNVTATESTSPGFLTVYGYGGERPWASSLNTHPGLNVPNHVMTPVGQGKLSIFNSVNGPNHVITDLLGYFTQG
ncbi:PKD domain-containing protein [Streptomyces sp. NPDC059874]|uniref:PKD domain-containing protein n=1 Tax=Streptomyces sp. NPDC059874 TaxID=3346983 RepID=UPI003669BA26